MESLLLSSETWCTQDFVCALQAWSLFPAVLWKSYNKILLCFKIRFPGDSHSLYWVLPSHGNLNLHNSGRSSLVLLFSSLWVTHPLDMGFDFIVIVPILPSHCGSFFVFGCGISGILLSMVVQQLVVALVSSTPSSWIRRNNTFCLISLLSESEVAQSCPTLCNPIDCSPPGSSFHGILQSRILEWVAISLSRESSPPKDQTQVSCIAGRRFNLWATYLAGLTKTLSILLNDEDWSSRQLVFDFHWNAFKHSQLNLPHVGYVY